MLKFAFVSPGLCNFGQLVAPHLNEIFIWGSLISNYSMCPYKSNHYVLKNRKQASFCDSFFIINCIILPKYFFLHFICVRFKIIFYFFSFVLGFKGGKVFLNTFVHKKFWNGFEGKKSYDLEKNAWNYEYTVFMIQRCFFVHIKILMSLTTIKHCSCNCNLTKSMFYSPFCACSMHEDEHCFGVCCVAINKNIKEKITCTCIQLR